MFKSVVNVSKNANVALNKYLCLQTSDPKKWDILTAICVERRPVISPRLNKIEEEFQKLLSQIEHERSLKCDNEMRHEEDVRLAKRLQNATEDVDVVIKQTAQDLEDAAVEELSKFKFQSRLTRADETGVTTTVKRKLDKHLLLLVEQTVGEQKMFLPPQGIREEGESLRQTAERILKQTCGSDVKAQFYGNAPSGFYKYKYPQGVQKDGVIGAKIFFFWAKYIQGLDDGKDLNVQWLDKRELQDVLPVDYKRSIFQLLIDDNEHLE